ncbi:MAG TPA: hypothetical protein VKU91_04640, partial [Acidimicrobiales bacterium]|nr:hypothetical protein [Acidimicrobiales bacterium]
AGPDTVVVADGFSCKTQIEQSGAGRRPLHLGELMRLAATGEEPGPQRRPAPPRGRRAARTVGPLAALAGGVAAGLAVAAGRCLRT